MQTELNEKVIEHIKDLINIHTSLEEKDGNFNCELYVDYRDELSDETIKKIIQSDEPMDEFYNSFEIYDDEEWGYVFNQIKTHWELEDEDGINNFDEYENLIIDWINEHIYFDFPYDHFLKQDVCVNIIVNTGDGNYDFTLNNWLTWDAREEEINDESSILWLVKQQGYTKKHLENLIENHETIDSKFLKSVYQECENVTTHMNALAFFIKMTLKEFIEFQENPKDLTLSEKTSCGLYDCWNGAGGCLEIHLEKPVVIPKDFIEMHIDGTRGYGVDQIYGMCSSFWD